MSVKSLGLALRKDRSISKRISFRWDGCVARVPRGSPQSPLREELGEHSALAFSMGHPTQMLEEGAQGGRKEGVIRVHDFP